MARSILSQIERLEDWMVDDILSMTDEEILAECREDGEGPVRTTPMDRGHLNALELRLSHERGCLAQAKTKGERELRRMWIAQVEREIADERKFIGEPSPIEPEMSDDELLAALNA